MVRSFFYTTIQSVIMTVCVLSLLSVSYAQIRTSPSYQLQSDSINIGGGLSSSTNYIQESTVGEIATGRSTSSNYQLRAGYQQMQEVFLSMTPPDDVIMSPDLPGITGGESNGSTTFTVITDSPSGYTVGIVSSQNPAMERVGGSEVIANHPETTNPAFTFNYAANEAIFGFTAEGNDIGSTFQDNGSLCNVGTNDTIDRCWRSLRTGSAVVARSTSSNHPDGATTTLKFKVGVGSSAGVIAGTYIATSTITALPL